MNEDGRGWCAVEIANHIDLLLYDLGRERQYLGKQWNLWKIRTTTTKYLNIRSKIQTYNDYLLAKSSKNKYWNYYFDNTGWITVPETDKTIIKVKNDERLSLNVWGT